MSHNRFNILLTKLDSYFYYFCIAIYKKYMFFLFLYPYGIVRLNTFSKCIPSEWLQRHGDDVYTKSVCQFNLMCFLQKNLMYLFIF